MSVCHADDPGSIPGFGDLFSFARVHFIIRADINKTKNAKAGNRIRVICVTDRQITLLQIVSNEGKTMSLWFILEFESKVNSIMK